MLPVLRRHYANFIPEVPGKPAGGATPATYVLAAGYSGDEPFIVDVDPHGLIGRYEVVGFHAVGSGAAMAQQAGALLAQYRMTERSVDHGVLAAMRTLDALDRTSPSIGGPMNICRMTPDGAHHLDEKEIDEARERVRRWVDLEQRALDELLRSSRQTGRREHPMTARVEPAGAHELDRRGATPLWVQLLADLRRRLGAGEFSAAFPGELALVAEYRVSRHTVREALRRLREEGLVVAERGRPPRLASPTEIAQPLGTPYSLFQSVEATGRVQRNVVRTLDVRADGVVAARLGLEESTPLVHLERLRFSDEEPLAIDRVWMPERLAAPLLDADFARTALYDEYAARCGIRVTGGHEHLRAVVPDEAERELLGTGPEVAAFAIDRLGLRARRPWSGATPWCAATGSA